MVVNVPYLSNRGDRVIGAETSAIDAVDGSSLGTRVPSMWALF